jgi:hypothetical protein
VPWVDPKETFTDHKPVTWVEPEEEKDRTEFEPAPRREPTTTPDVKVTEPIVAISQHYGSPSKNKDGPTSG